MTKTLRGDIVTASQLIDALTIMAASDPNIPVIVTNANQDDTGVVIDVCLSYMDNNILIIANLD